MLRSLVRHNDFSVSNVRTEPTHDTSSSPYSSDSVSLPPSAASVPVPGFDSGDPSSLPGMATPVPAMTASDFDTFWAKFAVPPVGQPVQANTPANSLPVPSELPAPSSFLLPPENVMNMTSDVSSVVHPKDMLMGNPLNFNVGTIGPFTDDFIRSLDDYAKSGPHSTSLPFP